MTPRLILLLLILVTAEAAADRHVLPKFELGVSLFSLTAPNYRGSAHSTSYLLPVPHIKYRGERWRIDEGLEGRLFDSENLILSISGNGSPPVDEDTPERTGMASLEANVEIGPSLEYRIHQGERDSLWFELPLRIAFTIENSPQNIGQILHPRLAWRLPSHNKDQWKLRFAAGPLYASKRFHDYYYSVDAADALPTRPVFQAEAGYSGLRADFTYSKRFGEYWLGGFVRYDSLNGSVIEDSPLVSDASNWMAGIAIGWVFHEKYPD
jgi:outer membrane scaffolding protein for murein synthesis (MipA/OmpV family)